MGVNVNPMELLQDDLLSFDMYHAACKAAAGKQTSKAAPCFL